MRKYWREIYLCVMMTISIAILIASALNLVGLIGLATTAGGVFVGVLGIGMYDSWYDALAKVNDYQPNLIFCDILMPRLDGYQTCAIIKRNARFCGVPVIMLSSKDGLFDKARGRMVGSEDYLTKPFTKDQLLAAVERHRRAD